MSKYFKRFCPLILALFCLLPSMASAAQTSTRPNDTFYDWEWGMDYVHAPEAWAAMGYLSTTTKTVVASSTRMGRDIVVAMIDGGVDFTHPDLKDAMWTNPDEKMDGKDDDGDGYVDDVHGWNFVTDSPDIRPIMKTIMYMNGAWVHGTAVASLIAGRGNDDIGMAGLAWHAKIMPLVILGADGAGDTGKLADAIRYAVAHRADIINLSLEGEGNDPDVRQAIQEATAQGVLVVIAAGNSNDGGINLDETPQYPSCDQGAAEQGVLVVAALDETGGRNASSNYGRCVNISAPGADILAARPIYDESGNTKDVSGYGTLSGTSLAAPFVSGAAALLKAQHPDWKGEQLATRLLATALPFKTASETTGLGRGVLDVAAAVAPASVEKYGPWKLLAANPGSAPYVWITDEKDHILYSIQVGDMRDTRGLHAIFVHWDADRLPDVLVTSQGDESGAWRVYRWDGVILAAGQVSQDASDKIHGGLYLAAQDLKAQARETVLLSEADGPRAWRLDPETGLGQAFYATLDRQSYGSMAVGVQRPVQSMLLLSRSQPNSSLTVLRDSGLGEGAAVTTTNPANARILQGLSADGREVVRLLQSGKPTDLTESPGLLDVTPLAAEVITWQQAPSGLEETGPAGRRFYDFWPR